jgi:hypothetical protein
MKKKRIKHNNLLPWFREDHAQLPASYVKSCQEFFDEISKRQATSSKPQATSDKRQAATCTNKRIVIDIDHE